MSEERKRAVWPWVAALLIGLPVLYVLSYGPACWLIWNVELSQPVLNFLDALYCPFRWSQTTFDWAYWYGSLFVDESRPRAN
jgi:hypothetical protein